MSEKPAKAQDVVKLNVETNLYTTEGRIFLNQLNTVSRVLTLREAEVEFKGELVFKTGYLGDYKSVQLYKCPGGYFLFFDMAFGQNNRSLIGETLDDLLAKVDDNKVKERILAETAAVAAG